MNPHVFPATVDTRPRICSDARVKFFAPSLLLIAFAFSACNTASNRRALYSPAKGSGPYTEARKTGSWRHGKYPVPKPERKSAEPTVPPVDTAPTPPPAI